MSSSTFRWCYSTLDVSSKSSWESVRLAYRRKLRAFHPDRAPDEAESDSGTAEREETFKDTVRAYRALASYYKLYGALPSPHQLIPDHLSRETSGRRRWNRKQTTSRPGRASGVPLPAIHQFIVGGFLVSVGVAAGANFLSGDEEETSRKVSPDAPHLALGMEPTHVVESQGVPTFTKGSVWFYGDSGVIFDKGCVIGWENSGLSPLRTNKNDSSTHAEQNARSEGPWFVKGRCRPDGS